MKLSSGTSHAPAAAGPQPAGGAAAAWNLPHLLACLLVGMTLLLLSFGALVTTYEAAMAVPDWPGTYGHNMFLFPLAEWLGGPWDLFLEHGHRLLGATVGLITLALAATAWRWPVGPRVRWLCLAAVVLVVVQGGLGGARVLLDDTTVAKVHACTGPLFFAVAVAVAMLSRRAAAVEAPRVAAALTMALPVAAYAQLVAGAQLRHLDPATPPATFHALVGTHVMLGLLVAGLAYAAFVRTWRQENRPARRWALVAAVLVSGQLALGGGTWVAKYGLPSAILPDAWRLSEAIVARGGLSSVIVTAHAVLGMVILAVGVAVAIAAVGGGAQACDSGQGIRRPSSRLQEALA
ncbi:MAG: Heme synthase [Planctomycetota bacterium]